MDYAEKAKEFVNLIPLMKDSARQEMVQKLSQGEWHMLGHLYMNGGSVMAGELAKCAKVSTARVTAMLKGTEKKGYVRREVVEGDRRKTKVVLTDAGRDMVQELYRESLRHTAQYLEALGPEDTENLLRIMRKTADIVGRQE